MECTNATKFYRKSGGAKWRDLQFYGPLLEMFFDSKQRSGATFFLTSHQPEEHSR
jgi:hypothetical protein